MRCAYWYIWYVIVLGRSRCRAVVATPGPQSPMGNTLSPPSESPRGERRVWLLKSLSRQLDGRAFAGVRLGFANHTTVFDPSDPHRRQPALARARELQLQVEGWVSG